MVQHLELAAGQSPSWIWKPEVPNRQSDPGQLDLTARPAPLRHEAGPSPGRPAALWDHRAAFHSLCNYFPKASFSNFLAVFVATPSGVETVDPLPDPSPVSRICPSLDTIFTNTFDFVVF